ncbi:MAG: hypothetical protein K9W43_06510 [Candidatus Thorarchaeota archaeon]|nr:hypothetical protein [Candidatus Thorarchaeota archaeon]
MNSRETITKFVITHYGNLIRNDDPTYDEVSRRWIARLQSDYPIIIHNDLTSETRIRFLKVSPLGYVVFNEQFHPHPDLITPRETIVSRLRSYLHMWRSYTESLLLRSSADKIAQLPEVLTALNPVYEILLTLYEEEHVNLTDFSIEGKTKGRKKKMRKYIALLQELEVLRPSDHYYVPGNLFVMLLEKQLSFENITTAVMSEILRRKYEFLREVMSLGNLERIIRVANIVYYTELHTKSEVPRSWSTLMKEFSCEYDTSISPSSIKLNLYKLVKVGVIGKSKSLYHGTSELRSKMIEMWGKKPSPDTIWRIPKLSAY